MIEGGSYDSWFNFAVQNSFSGTEKEFLRMHVLLDGEFCNAIMRRYSLDQMLREQVEYRDGNLWPDEDAFRYYLNRFLKKKRMCFWLRVQGETLNRFGTAFRGSVNACALSYLANKIPFDLWESEFEYQFSYMDENWHAFERSEFISEYIELYREARNGIFSYDFNTLRNQERSFSYVLGDFELALYRLADNEGKIAVERPDLQKRLLGANAVRTNDEPPKKNLRESGQQDTKEPVRFEPESSGRVGVSPVQVRPASHVNPPARNALLPEPNPNHDDNGKPHQQYHIPPWTNEFPLEGGGIYRFASPLQTPFNSWEKLRFFWYIECCAACSSHKVTGLRSWEAQQERDRTLQALWGKFYPSLPYEEEWVESLLYPDRESRRWQNTAFSLYCRATGIALHKDLEMLDASRKVHLNTLLLGRAVSMAMANANLSQLSGETPRSMLPAVLSYLDSVAYVPINSEEKDKQIILSFLALYTADETWESLLEPGAVEAVQRYQEIIRDNYKTIRDLFSRQNAEMQKKVNEAHRLAEGAEFNLKKRLIRLLDLGSNGHCLSELYRFLNNVEDYTSEQIRSDLFVLFSALNRLDISPLGGEALDQRITPGNELFEKSAPALTSRDAQGTRYLLYPGWVVNGITVVPPIYTLRPDDNQPDAEEGSAEKNGN